MEVSVSLSYIVAVLAILAPVQGFRTTHWSPSRNDQRGLHTGFSILQSGLRFGQAYVEVDLHSGPDGSLVVNFGGAPSEDLDEELTEGVVGGSSEPGESPESHPAEGRWDRENHSTP